ncbi:MAG: glycosyltransferase family 2 protein, partial [Actinobacteria bacterium]|nr:glycosyltransferase family 2 protein [Actinomycetota bacterium]
DDGSTDSTARIAEESGARVIRQDQSGKATALNTGIGSASGEIVVVIDADTVLEADFLQRVIPHFDDDEVVAVAGNVKVGNRSTVLSRLQALEYLMSLNLDRRAQAQLNCVAVVPGAAGAFRRSTLIEVGGYPSETLVEDTDLTVALLQHGGRIPYEPRAVAWTEAPETAADVLKQRHRWSFGTVQVAAKRSDLLFRRNSGRLGVLALPWLILSQILLPITGPLVDLYLLVLLAQRQWTQAAVIAALSIGADLVVAAVAIHLDRERWRLLWWTPGLRLIWRPLQLAAVIRSGFRWLAGSRQSWRHVQRYGTVVPNL